jgi:hypothetical protein
VFKDNDSAWYYIKKRPSGQTNTDPMTVSAPNESSAVFIATKSILSVNTYDTVRVLFRTSDRFLSKERSQVYAGPPVAVNEEPGIPTVFALHQNYPNPFIPLTTIRYDLPRESFVTLKLYDILGREVATLVNEEEDAGYKQAIWDATNFASGVYFYRLVAGDFVQTKKAMVVK